MNGLLFSILIALAANLDNLGVGVAYGIHRIRVSHTANVIIAAVSFAATWVSAAAGQTMAAYVSPGMARITGAILLCGVGMWVLVEPLVAAYRTHQPIIDLQVRSTRIYIGPIELLRHPERAASPGTKDIGYWQAVLLGVALCMNALAGGFDAGAMGVSAVLVSMLVGAFSLLAVPVGCHLGSRWLAQQPGRYAECIAGMLLVTIGLYQFKG